jgi:hypothetical protein
MKLFRCLLALTVVCALSSMAKADDFKLGVLDAGPTSIVYTGGTLDVTFGSCGGHTPLDYGCVTILNDSGKTITSLTIDVPSNAYTGPQTGGGNCLTGPGFATCAPPPLVDGDYQFLFTGLDIPYGGFCDDKDTFEIEEQGVDPQHFPTITVSSSVTPEPASLLLLATGAFLCAGFVYRRRMGTGPLGS